MACGVFRFSWMQTVYYLPMNSNDDNIAALNELIFALKAKFVEQSANVDRAKEHEEGFAAHQSESDSWMDAWWAYTEEKSKLDKIRAEIDGLQAQIDTALGLG